MYWVDMVRLELIAAIGLRDVERCESGRKAQRELETNMVEAVSYCRVLVN